MTDNTVILFLNITEKAPARLIIRNIMDSKGAGNSPRTWHTAQNFQNIDINNIFPIGI